MVKMLHTCIRVKDLEASLKFYKALGLMEVSRKDHTENGFILVYLGTDMNSYQLELTYNIGHEGYTVGNGFSHIAIGVDNLEKEHQRLKELGFIITDLKGLPGNAPNYFFVTDPDGYQTEVIRNK